MMSSDRIFLIEDALDRSELTEAILKLWPEAAALMCATAKKDWNAVLAEAENLFFSAQDSRERSFALQWGVIVTEIRFDLRLRVQWMRRWDEIEAWSGDWYCRYLRAYQDGLTYFFKGALREAHYRFQKALELASENAYDRGRQRSLFHLGLVERDLGHLGQASRHFHAALKISRDRGAFEYAKRIEAQLERIGSDVAAEVRKNDFRLDRAKIEIENLIRERKFIQARSLLIKAELFRRRSGIGRKREGLAAYLPLLAMGRGRAEASVQRRFSKFVDPILKIRILELKREIVALHESEACELAMLKELHGVDSILEEGRSPADVRICGVRLRDLASDETRKLMLLLLESPNGVTKEQLCVTLWKLSYDPIVHDSKIYKLIHRARALFSKSDLILNGYGAYRLNPDYRPSRHASQVA